MMALSQLPLFPLVSVLFPGTVLPLRIFEVRYLDMIGRCIKEGAPFGVVCLSKGQEVAQPEQTERFASVGTLAQITQHEAPQPGLRLVHCLGMQRFRITASERLKHGLWIAEIETIARDQTIAVPEELQACSQLLAKVIANLPVLARTQMLGEKELNEQLQDCSWVANRWCQLLPIPLEMRQRLLELDSPLIRLELVSDIIDRLGLRG